MRRRLRPRGFTLIEVMVGALLLVVAMAGLVPFFLSSLNQSTLVRYKSTATNIARERMEEIRQLDYREIVDADTLEARFGATEAVRDVIYDIAYLVEESTYQAGLLKQVTVTVGWTAPPKVSAASVSTMIHQQYVGPRISRMEVREPDPGPDPLHTPFDCLVPDTTATVYCYIAEADWGLVIDDLNGPGMAVSDAFMRLNLVDSIGTALPQGDPANDYKITNLQYTVDSGTGDVKEVYFSYPIHSGDVPDGYWEFQAVCFNRYEEPGNLWRLRLRVENDGPAAPTAVEAVPQVGNASIRLYWSGGDERDRDYYVVERRKWDWTGSTWGAWIPVDSAVNPNAISLLDEGALSPPEDPWGDAVTQNWYQYRVWAVDIAGNPGAPGTDDVILPPSTPVTTTTTSIPLTTTTVVGGTTTTEVNVFSVVVDNTTNKSWSLSWVGDNGVTGSDSIGKKTTKTISGLPAGSYDIYATTEGRDPLEGSFTLDGPEDQNMIVLTIL